MVYITSDLFGPNTAHDWKPDDSPSCRQTMAQDQHAARLGKRKRQAASDGPHVSQSRQHRFSPGRDATRLHVHNTPPFEATNTSPYAFFPPKAHEYTSDRRPVKQLKRINPKPSLPKSTSHLMDVDLASPSYAVSDLRSCHACNKAPKRKKDLENYLDCRQCQGRTCFICARQCVGCTKAICNKCIVEVGEEGDAWCLDCYARNINS